MNDESISKHKSTQNQTEFQKNNREKREERVGDRRSAPLLVLLRSRRAPWFSILFGTCIPWEEDERGNEWEGKGTTERLEPG